MAGLRSKSDRDDGCDADRRQEDAKAVARMLSTCEHESRLERCRCRLLSGSALQPRLGFVKIVPAQKEAGILTRTFPLTCPRQEARVLMRPIQVRVERATELLESKIEIVRLTEKDPIVC
jgi:hypothetical protein